MKFDSLQKQEPFKDNITQSSGLQVKENERRHLQRRDKESHKREREGELWCKKIEKL